MNIVLPAITYMGFIFCMAFAMRTKLFSQATLCKNNICTAPCQGTHSTCQGTQKPASTCYSNNIIKHSYGTELSTANCNILAGLPKSKQRQAKIILVLLATLLLLCFLLLPVGSLPALLGWPFSIFIVGASIALGYFVLSPNAGCFAGIKKYSLGLLVAGAFACLGLLAYKKGLPGLAFSTDNFIAVPIWQAATLMGKIGLGLTFIGLLLFLSLQVALLHSFLHGIINCLLALLLAASIVTVFIPFNASAHLRLSLPSIIWLDTAAFFIKILLVILISKLFRRKVITNSSAICFLLAMGQILLIFEAVR